MSKKILIIILLLSIISFIYSLDIPELKSYVNDYADMISPEVEKEIENKLIAFDKSDSTQIVILTIPSLEGDSLEEFCIKVAEKNKIGQKNKDNGVLFLVSKNDRKMRIEVGRGLEGVITDLLAGRIVDNVAAPNFKSGNMDKGFAAVTDALIGVSKGEYTAEKLSEANRSGGMAFILFIFIFLILTIIWFSFSRRIPLKIRVWLGGIFGGISFASFILVIGIIEIFGIVLFFFVGFILGIIFTLIFTISAFRAGSAGRSTSKSISFSSNSRSSGSSSSSISSHSSFSGGGGHFSGGGASGSW